MKYSVIIPFHSNQNLLTLCIASLMRSIDLCESEIIIVDNNASGSQIPPALKDNAFCKIITVPENLMYPKAVNAGVSYATGTYLILCDADVCVTPRSIDPLIAALNEDGVGYACSKLLNMQTNNLLEFGITYSDYNFPHPFTGRPRDFPLISNNHYPLAACAACSAIKKDLFVSVNGFDERLIHSYSDIDLCLRLSANGYKTVCVADSIVYHCGASTVGSGMSVALKEDTKGVFRAKHPNIPILIYEYLDLACDFFISENGKVQTDYFVFDCSTIGNPTLYTDYVCKRLNIQVTSYHQRPYAKRDAMQIDYLNYIPHTIRDYRVPILYFVDSFLSFQGNALWKICREGFGDIVLDRHANLELLQNI